MRTSDLRALLLIAFAFLAIATANAQTAVTAGTVTVSWNAVTEDINGNSLAGSTVTYKVYGSQGCGAKTLQATTTATSAQISVAAGCYSIAVSASDAAGEGAVSPTLTLTVSTPQAIPAQVTGVVVTQ